MEKRIVYKTKDKNEEIGKNMKEKRVKKHRIKSVINGEKESLGKKMKKKSSKWQRKKLSKNSG